MVPTWKKDLDALVTETMAFAASANEKKRVQSKQVDPLVADTTASESDAKDEVVQPDLLATVEAVLAEEFYSPQPSTRTAQPHTRIKNLACQITADDAATI